MMLVGLGVGIDYALLIFSRYRAELRDGTDRETATRVSMDAAGRTVFFAGCTVIIALLGLVVARPRFTARRGAGGRADRTDDDARRRSPCCPRCSRSFGRRSSGAWPSAPPSRPTTAVRKAGGGGCWASAVQRRPWAALLLGGGGALRAGRPRRSICGWASPTRATSRKTKSSQAAYDLLADGFGPGFNGPLIIVAEGKGTGPADDAADAAPRPNSSGVRRVATRHPRSRRRDPSAATVLVFPDSAPQDEATASW